MQLFMIEHPDISLKPDEPFNLKWTLESCNHEDCYVDHTKTSRFGWLFILFSMLILGYISFLLLPLAFIGFIFRDKFVYCSHCGSFMKVVPTFKFQGLPGIYKRLSN